MKNSSSLQGERLFLRFFTLLNKLRENEFFCKTKLLLRSMLSFDQTSYWEKTTFLNNIDNLIIGSGIVGLSTAIHLKNHNPKLKVVIIERGYLPSGASTKNAGFACIGSASEILADLANSNESEVWATIQKRWDGLQYLKELLGENTIDFQAPSSHELYSRAEKDEYQYCLDQLNQLNKTLKEISGIDEVYSVDNQIIQASNFNGFQYAIRNIAEGQLDTGKMMQALLQKAQAFGVIILNGIEVSQIYEQHIECNYGKIEFKQLAICNNGLAAQFLDEDIKPARAQVVVTSPIENLSFQGTYHFDQGYYYFRNIGNRVLFGGGRNINFEAEETDELNTSDQIINHLSAILEEKILPNSAFTIEHHWAGTMGVGDTKAPIIKRVRGNIYCAVRLGGMGVAIGSLVGKELAELMGKRSM